MRIPIAPLTSLRFLAALAVVLFHMRDYGLAGWRGGVIERGGLAVDFFFILSGFILAHAHGAEFAAGRGSLRGFLAARVARLYPVHAVVLAMFVVYVLLLGAFGFSYNAARYTAGGLLAHVLLLPAWNVGPAMSWNFPDWSIGAEASAYLCFPALAPMLLNGARARAAMLLALVLGGFLILDPVLHLTSRTVDYSVLRILPEFVMGMLAYRLSVRVPPHMAEASFAAAAACLAGALLWHFADAVVVVLFVPLVVTAARMSGSLSRFLSAPILVRLGEASYSLYMVHALVLSMVYSAVKVPAIGRHLPVFAADVACPLLAVGAALVLYHRVEVPGRHAVLALLHPDRSRAVRGAVTVSP